MSHLCEEILIRKDRWSSSTAALDSGTREGGDLKDSLRERFKRDLSRPKGGVMLSSF